MPTQEGASEGRPYAYFDVKEKYGRLPTEPTTEETATQFVDSIHTAVEDAKEDPWTAYYREKIKQRFPEPDGLDYYLLRRKPVEQRPVIEEVCARLPETNPRLAVLGVGPGAEPIFFSHLGVEDITSIDIEKGALELTKENAQTLGVALPDKYVQADAREPLPIPEDSFDVLLCTGLLEHFPDEEIEAVIRNSLAVSKCCVFVVLTDLASVPENRRMLGISPISSKNPAGNFGNERNLSAQEWSALFAKAGEDLPGYKIENRFGYWIPEFGTTTEHPFNPEEYFGKGLFAGFVLTRT